MLMIILKVSFCTQIETHVAMHIIIMLLKKNTATGHDCLPGSIMKHCTEYFIYLLTHVIIHVIKQGYTFIRGKLLVKSYQDTNS